MYALEGHHTRFLFYYNLLYTQKKNYLLIHFEIQIQSSRDEMKKKKKKLILDVRGRSLGIYNNQLIM